jgi:hypothetical protein
VCGIFWRLSCQQLWVAFRVGNHFRYLPIHDLVHALGPQKALALPFVHAFTGCDTVSAFVGRGKKTCWDVWKKYPEVTDTFIDLFLVPGVISESIATDLQRFVIKLNDVNTDCDNVNVARKRLFSNKGKTTENISPTHDALMQHVRRAVYQAGHVWGQSLTSQQILPNPSDWGWQMIDGNWTPL